MKGNSEPVKFYMMCLNAYIMFIKMSVKKAITDYLEMPPVQGS